MHNSSYFRRNQKKYHRAVKDSQDLYSQCARILEQYLQGSVLDIGNGGVINYALHKVDKLVCQDLIFEKRKAGSEKISYVYGDFYDYEPVIFPDVVIAQFLLHHLVDDVRLVNSLKKLRQNMPLQGRLIIAEVKLPESVCFAHLAVLPLLNRCLKKLGKPQVRFFSVNTLSALLAGSGFRIESVQDFRIAGIVNPAPVIMPVLKIPGSLYPFKIMVVKAAPQCVAHYD